MQAHGVRLVTASGENLGSKDEEEWDGTIHFSEEEVEEMRGVFNTFDLDGGGAVGSDELLEALALPSVTPPHSHTTQSLALARTLPHARTSGGSLAAR